MNLIKYRNIQWLNISDVSSEEIQFLGKKYFFHDLDLEDCLSDIQRPKIDEYDKYNFIVLHFPILNKKLGYFETQEIDIFISERYIITLYKGASIKILDQLIKEMHTSVKKRRAYLSQGPSFFLYKLLSLLFDNLFPKIDKINREILATEEAVFTGDVPKNVLKDIMVIKRNIIHMRRILLPQRSVIAALEHKLGRFNLSELDIYFDDIVDKVEKLWSNLETSKEVIESVQESYESMISHNINMVMKTLTVFSVIMLPLTLISGIYGMNVPLPLSESEHALPIMVVLMLGVIMLMLTVFKWRKWL